MTSDQVQAIQMKKAKMPSQQIQMCACGLNCWKEIALWKHSDWITVK